MKKTLIPTILLCLIAFATRAQKVSLDSSNNYAIAARIKEGSIVLRWAPRDYGVWQLANKNGYVLERAAIPKSTEKYPSDLSKLTYTSLGTFRPYTLKEWKTRTDTTQIANVTAAQALYGKADYTPAVGGGGFGALRQMSMEQNMRHAFAIYAADLLPQAAEGLGWRYEDKNISTDNHYVYRIFNLPSKKGYVTDTAYVELDPAYVTQIPSVKTLYVEELDGKIKVLWSKLANAGRFTAYHVEKSLDGGKSYQRISSLPVTFDFSPVKVDDYFFTDTQVINGQTYFYRVLGITAFGEWSEASAPVSGKGKDLSGSVPPTTLNARDIGGKFEISWTAPVPQTDDHAGWYVARAINATGPFAFLHEKPLPKNQLRFVDESPIPLLPNYYVVYAADDKNNVNQSPVIMGVHLDSIPPKRPEGLTGISDSTGRITLTWNENKEIDLMGYRVFMATGKDREWFQLTSAPIPETTFQTQVPLNTLSEKVFFTIIALDHHYNPSDYAAVAEVLLPDTIAPERPLITNYAVEDKGVRLTWARSYSQDVKSIHLLRKKTDARDWQTIADVTNYKANTFLDTSAHRGAQYDYVLVAKDDAGLVSGKENALTIALAGPMKRAAVANLQGRYEKAEKRFVLSWEYKPTGRYNFQVYRATPGLQPEFIAQVSGAERSFSDPGLVAQKEGYEYFVKAIWADGSESDLSAPFDVRFTR